jgi:hypothetical protein
MLSWLTFCKTKNTPESMRGKMYIIAAGIKWLVDD